MHKKDTLRTDGHAAYKNIGGVAIYMVGFCLLFALAFGLSDSNGSLLQLIRLYIDHSAAGGALTFLIAAIVFLFVYFATSSLKKDSLANVQNRRKLQANEDLPMVYTERSQDQVYRR
jgi:hypothetical protein